MTYTDYGIVLAGLILFFSGYRNGLCRTLSGPVAFLLCCVGAVIYYDITGNILYALMIASIGTLLLSMAFRLVLMIGKSTIGKTGNDTTILLSRILGGLVNLAWRGSLLFGILFLVTLIPFNALNLGTIKNDINGSVSFSILNRFVLNRIPQTKKIKQAFRVLENPKKLQTLSMDPEYKALLSDPKVKDITEDQEIQKLINKQDYLKLLSHPKIKSLMKDDTLLEKIARLSESLTRETPGGKTAP
ncbi:MAG TPA: CvpA family protein [Candidatus Omnitrophota bacterium]|nr:CvpA family protein [Candidatus Omnitrophota bacterium]HPB68094.1 CvpA family protein [Candidatus Omnitrophota bacterium]HQO58243.1 CvpA family protein [Candidatus Omnitrophota bacterium]HQP11264.1 CvpA family protein [Candidatus Omnitrophota bacterium]